jgi:hypothetical protein
MYSLCPFECVGCACSDSFFIRFLVEGSQGAVLHTGDFRAEPWFLDNIRRNPVLQPYLAPPEAPGSALLGQRDNKYQGDLLFKTLDAIYLDTACLLSTTEVPTKVHPLLFHAYICDSDLALYLRAMPLSAWFP